MKTLFATALVLFAFCACGQETFSLPNATARGAAGPAWGPYSNRYAGISHIADTARGLRFDFSVFLARYLGKIVVPNQRFESDWYPWDASPDLNYYSFREELDWKDKVFADVAFAPLDSHRRLMKITLTNNLPAVQSLALHFMAGMNYPDVSWTRAHLPPGRTWTSAIDYTNMDYVHPRKDDNLVADGLLKGEVKNSDFVNGSGLGTGFGEQGDRVQYTFSAQTDYNDATFVLRYRIAVGKKAVVRTEGLCSGELELPGTGAFEIKKVPIGTLKKGAHSLTLTAVTNVPLDLNGFTVVEEKEASEVRFESLAKKPAPLIEQPVKNAVVLKYADVPQYYGIAWNDSTEYKVRELATDELDNAIRTIANDNIYPHHYTPRDAHTTNVLLRAIPLPPHSQKTFYALLLDGSRDEVLKALRSFPSRETIEAAFRQTPKYPTQKANAAGRKYAFAMHMLQTTALQNIVYPIYTQRQQTRQFVPGKRWSSLYTWDNGFIGIGMANVAVQRAVESLQVYTTDSANENAYTHHGSLVPVQFFLYKEIWDKTLSKDLLAYFYPRLKKYYRFFCGEYGSSTTRKLASGLLNTFDYFYNSGGWDDYPAQAYMHKQGLSAVTAPAISSSMAIRMAKIMRQAAVVLNRKSDIALYQTDIAFFTAALQKYSWDEASGYFGYVLHDKKTGKPSGLLRTAEGVNYNMGLDGIYPLVAGICTPVQRAAAFQHLFSGKGCWTDIGLSAVDQSAPYFSLNGYWNGAVWFPHQWIFWKTMLDEGEGERASQIATTGLDLYAAEVDSTYFTPEIFRIDTKRGNGWKQFSGLSSPLLSWYGAYFQPGTITTGFDTWVTEKSFAADKAQLKATLVTSGNADKKPVVLVCMPEGKKYRVNVNGKRWEYMEKIAGTLQIQLPGNDRSPVQLTIEPNE